MRRSKSAGWKHRTIDIERFVAGPTSMASGVARPLLSDADTGKHGMDAIRYPRTRWRNTERSRLPTSVDRPRESLVAIEPREKGYARSRRCESRRGPRSTRPYFEFNSRNGHRTQEWSRSPKRSFEQQSGPFDRSEFEDRYEDALRALIKSKQDGGDGGVTAQPPQD